MDGGRSSLSPHDVQVLFGMLESSDEHTIESIKALIHENFSATKEAWLIYALLDYYIAVQSVHALDILVRIREPHDKHMFDRMVEYLKNECTRYHCLLLLSHLVYRQPSWLFKVTQHRIFQVWLNLLKTETDLPCIVCALFSIISLLPMIPSQIGVYLSDIFEIFSRLIAWTSKKCVGVPEVYVLHLQVGVYALFHRLYGMYPCNFLSYLRSFYGGRQCKEEKLRIFTSSIRPMLERVKLHPLLITACKESEISPKRWKKMATHDIMALCASISLDPVEGTPEDIHCASIGSAFANQATQSQENTMQYFNSMSSTVSTSIELDHNAKICDTWTPSRICSFSTPPPESFSKSTEENLEESQSSISHYEAADNLHIEDSLVDQEDIELVGLPLEEKAIVSVAEAMEAREEESQSSISHYEAADNIHIEDSLVDQEDIELAGLPLDEKAIVSVAEAMEAREEELVDNEVCELLSMNPVLSEQSSSRHDTPFRSTTQNLTDQAGFTTISALNSSSSKDEEVEESQFSMAEISELKMKTLVHTMSRLRYFSQCGPQPETSVEFPVHSIRRSMSCPPINTSETNVPLDSSHIVPGMKDERPPVHSGCNISTLWNDQSAASCSMSKLPETPHDHLLPIALQPCSWSSKAYLSHSCLQHMTYRNPEYAPFYYGLSPAELLDRHLQMGSEAHLIQLDSIPLTSTRNTDWTHFGGLPPQDEIAIFKTQVQLLHNQVMFERHRREIHAERNRRFLGKVKRAQILEENTNALEKQVLLLQKENEQLKKELEIKVDLYHQLVDIKNQREKELNAVAEKVMQENVNLQFSNKKLQALLVSQKNENNVLKADMQSCQSKLLDMEFKLELATAELEQSHKMEKELLWISKENILLREINQHHKEKEEATTEQNSSDIGSELMKEALYSDIKSSKQVLESKIVLIDALRGKIASLEEEVSALKSKFKEQSQIIEYMKDIHRNEVLICEERLAELRKIHLHHSAHILKLYHELEIAKSNKGVTASDGDGLGESISSVIDSKVPNFELSVDCEGFCSDLSSVITADCDDDSEDTSDHSQVTSGAASNAALDCCNV